MNRSAVTRIVYSFVSSRSTKCGRITRRRNQWYTLCMCVVLIIARLTAKRWRIIHLSASHWPSLIHVHHQCTWGKRGTNWGDEWGRYSAIRLMPWLGYLWNIIISKLFQPPSTSVWTNFISPSGNILEIIFHNQFTGVVQPTIIFQHVHCRWNNFWNNFRTPTAVGILFHFQTWLHVK